MTVTVQIFISLLICVFARYDYPVPNYGAGGKPWPIPREYTVGTEEYLIDPSSFTFVSVKGSNDILQKAFLRYQLLIFHDEQINSLPIKKNSLQQQQILNSLNITVETATEQDRIKLNTDESYSLKITSLGATLNSNTVFGALRGLETFSQLVIRSPTNYTIKYTTINDSPRYSWRGLLLDTSRHFLSVETIKRTISAMSYDKLNVFHWHIIDGQSFPLESKLYPLLSQKGSYHPREIYTQEQIKEIIIYANARGVRIVPEFDMPAHASSWGFGYPWLIVNCTKQSNPFDFNDGWGDQPMDPTNPDTYNFIDKFLGEMTDLFVDEYLHLGGDEVPFNCWNITAINSWMKNHGISSYAELESYFIKNIFQLTKKYGKHIVYWEEVFENTSPDKNVIIDVWKSVNEIGNVVKAGFQATLSSPWYLDNLGETWLNFYRAEPEITGLTPDQSLLILGGEISSWGETVDDFNSDNRIWPRASAAAERLWSPKTQTNETEALSRLLYHRCRLVLRGVGAGPLQPGPGCY